MNTKLLRQKILDLAIRGKLTEQKKSDGTTKDLLAQISKQWLVSSKQDSQKENASSNVIASTTSTSSRTPIRDPFAASKNSDDVIASTAKQSKKKTFAPKEIIPLDKSEAPFEIPENWEWVRLGDVCEIKSSKRVFESDYVESGVPFYRSKEIGDLSRGEEIKTSLFIKKIHFDDLKEKYGVPQAGDVLITSVGTIGNTWICDGRDFYYKDGNITQIRKNLHIESKYIQLFLASPVFFKQALSTAAGTAQAALTIVKLNALLFPLPPLAEQQRIVTAIEFAFAEITAIENNQELLKKHIKQGRQKILDLAIRGKLTQQLKTDGTTKDLLAQISKQWLVSSKQDSQKENVSFNVIANTTSTSSRTPIRDPFAASKNSDDVIASTAKQSKKNKTAEPKQIIPLDKSEAPFEIPENWEWVRLGNICQTIKRGKSPKYTESNSNTLVFAQKCNQKNGPVSLEKALLLDESTLSKYPQSEFMQYGDTVINSTGTGTLGRVGYFNVTLPEGISGIVPDSHVTTVRPACCNTQFIYYVVKCNQEYLEKQGEGSTNQKELKPHTIFDLPVALPPLAEQQRIVATIESAFTEFDAMEKGIL